MSLLDTDDFLNFLERTDFRAGSWGNHFDRYVETFHALQKTDFAGSRRSRALELGTSWVFSSYLQIRGYFSAVDVTDFDAASRGAIRTVRCPLKGIDESFRAFSVDLESDTIPMPDGHYDLVLCCEVLEHMDVDPMFMMAEINRCLRDGGFLILTTPNSTSSRIVNGVLNGYAPHFYMQYHKDRSPYRHNFEYAPRQLRQLLDAAGFSIIDLWTVNNFYPPEEEAMDLLHRHGFPTDERGDNIFAIARREGPVRERYPDEIYDVNT